MVREVDWSRGVSMDQNRSLDLEGTGRLKRAKDLYSEEKSCANSP